MKRLSLEELKAGAKLFNLEAIKGGDTNSCHIENPKPNANVCPADGTKVSSGGLSV
ncbi:MAG: hypothetical protein QM669_08315 [Siphonobacter sp.]